MLAEVIRELADAPRREDAVDAVQRLHRQVFANGLLCEASVAVASCLVGLLWRCPEHVEDLLLDLLSDISAATPCVSDPGVYGDVSRADCQYEISLGFQAYVEILDSSPNLVSRTACIDLIMSCGLFEPRLRDRAIYFLDRAKDLAGLEACGKLISASLDELRQRPPSA
ncbi:hypothetical protein TL08_23455 [Actinoalloteichus hymeniacidonis]|uniref:Uncharacterized protein n=2 Tax=Actinoalloteichus hymeniacidonis TaxID=340345 RepID=A0AAC9HUQ2_9PSEU|nr:hypothetical protein TL08_23455 [Actinoalloteichus hymeniacidonis]